MTPDAERRMAGDTEQRKNKGVGNEGGADPWLVKLSTGIMSAWQSGRRYMATRGQIAAAVDANFPSALAAGVARRARGDLAVSITYSQRDDRLRVELASGVAFLVPISKIQGLVGASSNTTRSVKIVGGGHGLHWPDRDLDISVPDLVAGCLGNKTWMASLAKHAGKKRSYAKAAAARENGRSQQASEVDAGDAAQMEEKGLP